MAPAGAKRWETDWTGAETSDLIHNGWALQPGERKVSEFAVSSGQTGANVRCSINQTYQSPGRPAGQSTRISAFYQKTGGRNHRTEPEFRDYRGGSTLTEVREDWGLGTVRVPNESKDFRPLDPRSHPAHPQATLRPPKTGVSAISAPRSQRSTASSAARSSASSVRSAIPEWAQEQAQEKWDFGQLPMYETSATAYGRKPKQQGWVAGRSEVGTSRGSAIRAAGKSVSGFVEPAELVAKLTRAGVPQ
jgi:hypothetical protein